MKGNLDNKYRVKINYIILGSDGSVYSVRNSVLGNLENVDIEGMSIGKLKTTKESEGDGWIPELRDGYTIIVTYSVFLYVPQEN